MTAAIKSSLSNLNQSLQKLETSLNNMQDNKPAPAAASGRRQPPSDLFAASGSTSSNNIIDAKALASRLDGAITKVEKLLREG